MFLLSDSEQVYHGSQISRMVLHLQSTRLSQHSFPKPASVIICNSSPVVPRGSSLWFPVVHPLLTLFLCRETKPSWRRCGRRKTEWTPRISTQRPSSICMVRLSWRLGKLVNTQGNAVSSFACMYFFFQSMVVGCYLNIKKKKKKSTCHSGIFCISCR